LRSIGYKLTANFRAMATFANAGHPQREADGETTPFCHPEHYHYDFDLANVTEVWRRGSVVASWLLDLTAISIL